MKILPPYPDHILKLMDKKDRPAGPGGKTREELLMAAEIESEKELQQQVRQLLNIRGIVENCDWMHKPRSGRVGWPDITFSVHGKGCLWECKLPGQKLTPDQEALFPQLEDHPNAWRVAIITSVRDAKTFLDAMERGTV